VVFPALALGRRGVWTVSRSSVERKRQEPSMSIFVAVRVTDATGWSQTRVGRRSHA